ncbi:MAG: D-tyrosyl-tRNA(Tyr) deacylase [Betaproteobacteria bacterium]|nr:D-tyrosyl-tRNA(Tyr) deacylase [Betaproteobacteria bacterium]MBK9607350.1 D-tyrosyl-tRNA(Tyr) deacylase [Betaproteobacteria bacterium]
MRAVIQRVTHASVTVDGRITGAIRQGLLLLVGIEPTDGSAEVEWLVRKSVNLRIFNDDAGVMNLSVQDIGGNILAVSQFTLYASTRKGNRPSYSNAAPPAVAEPVFGQLVAALAQALGRPVPTGIFGADMAVELNNDGPVTIWLDSRIRE